MSVSQERLRDASAETGFPAEALVHSRPRFPLWQTQSDLGCPVAGGHFGPGG